MLNMEGKKIFLNFDNKKHDTANGKLFKSQ